MRPARGRTTGTRAGATAHAARAHGYTLVELLLVVFVAAIVAGITVPQLLVGVDRARARGAARYLTAQLGMARTEAVARAAVVALRFRRDAAGTAISLVLDRNGNGVREQDVANGIDREIRAPVWLEALFPGVAVARPAATAGPAVQLGGSTMLSFTPSGTSTSGTIYILGRDGSQFAVRVLGVTGRVRLLRFDSARGGWIEAP